MRLSKMQFEFLAMGALFILSIGMIIYFIKTSLEDKVA